MKWKLKNKYTKGVVVRCTCNKHAIIVIDDSSKEEFKELLGWTEKQFREYTEPYIKLGDDTK